MIFTISASFSTRGVRKFGLLTLYVAVLAAARPSCYAQHNTILPKAGVALNSFTPLDKRILPITLSTRSQRQLVPARGICSTFPETGENDLMMSGNGKMRVYVYGDPLSEQIVFRHERLQQPWPVSFEAPKIAHVLPQVRDLIMHGKYREGLELSLDASTKAGFPTGTLNHHLVPAFTMHIEMPKTNGALTNYLRTTNFESGEVNVRWTDNQEEYERQIFVSRPDNVIVQQLKAPVGKLLTATLNLTPPSSENEPKLEIQKDFSKDRLIITGRFDPATGTTGYASVTKVILTGGKATIHDGNLLITNASSVVLLTRIEWYGNFLQSNVDALVKSVNSLPANYDKLLSHAKQVQAEMLDRASLSFQATDEERAQSGEELLTDQRSRIGYSPALLEKLFDMGRYWFMLECGDFPPIYGHLNINVNLQVSGGTMSNLPESMNSFFNWIEGVLPDATTNAKNIFGTRGALFSLHPDHQTGVLYHFDYVWPHHYWISAGGWSYSPFWDHYLATGDTEFLRKNIMPGLRELGLFYEDYLSAKDTSGNFIFNPSYSPENWPSNTYESNTYDDANGNIVNPPVVINATMDIMVCREVLTHLIEGATILGSDADKIPVWKNMLEKMPPYLLDADGALKEWAWPTLAERQDHRHASHLYGVWPADEIDPDRTPELARAAWIANRKRAQGNASGHGISHRMLAAARLKDSYLVNFELKQLLEQGYFGPTLASSHNPYTRFMPDQQGSVLTLLMEMLVYSRNGVVELLPAVPDALDHGSVKGILTRARTKIDMLNWDMRSGTIDLTVTPLADQDLTLIIRYGIESITAPAGVIVTQPKPGESFCKLHVQKNKPVTLHIKTGTHKPSDWMNK